MDPVLWIFGRLLREATGLRAEGTKHEGLFGQSIPRPPYASLSCPPPLDYFCCCFSFVLRTMYLLQWTVAISHRYPC